MLHRNLGLLLPLLLSVAGHATLLEALTQRQEPYWHGGIFLFMAPLLAMLVGGFLMEDGRRAGLLVSAAGAALHLLLDLSCAALLFLRPREWRLGLGAAAVGAVVAGWVLRQALRGLAPGPAEESGRPVSRLRHELDLLGGNAIAVTVIGAGFVAMGLYGLLRRLGDGGGVDGKLLGAIAFFGACAAVGLWMGLTRRAALLGVPAPRPFARLWPRRLRLVTAFAAREGFVQRDLRGLSLLRWQDLAAVSLGELHGNPAVYLWLLRDDAVERRWHRPVTEARAARFRRGHARGLRLCRALFGADLVVIGTACAGGAGVLYEALRRGLADPAWRATFPPMDEPPP